VPPTSTTTVVERYRTVRKLGSGGMATVFLAEDERLGRLVAIKRLHGESSEDVARRFRREARLGASLNHPGVVAIYDIASDDEGVWIVMEYVEGRTLREEIGDGPLAPERALPILRAVADALDHAHRHGVIHRDVKPANVLVRPDGTAKLADLGIAMAAEQSRITRSGAVLGTAAYMAPERLDGSPGGPAVDVYALAAVAFEALCGSKAVAGATPVEVARRVVSQPPPDICERLPEASAPLGDVLKRGLANDPDARQPTAGALVDELEAALALTPPAHERVLRAVHERAPARSAGRPAWLPLAAAAACLALLAAGFAIGFGGGSGDEASKSSGRAKPKRQAAAQHPKADRPRTTAPAAPRSEPAPTAAGDPAAAVNDFYTRAARGDYAGAWALAAPSARRQLGGLDAFGASQSSLESISFPKLKAIRQSGGLATVQLRSEAVHTDRVDRCDGTIDVVTSGGAWKLSALHIQGCKQKRRK
jgi:hypothetical protein